MKHKGYRRDLSQGQLAVLLIGPVFLFLSILTVYPMLQAFLLSLRDVNLLEPWRGEPFVGLKNYRFLWEDSQFWYSLRNTFLFVIVTIPLQTVFGFIIALIAHQAFRGRAIVRAAILLPWALPTSLNALIWRWMFNTDYGIFNDLLMRFGFIEERIAWLGMASTAMPAVMGTAVWKVSSFMGLMILAGLQSIPSDLYEAADIDGASPWQQFWRITVPLVKPALMIALIFRTIDALQASFDLFYVLTGGGPGGSTEILPMYIYNTTFRFMDFGYGSALAVALFLITMTISIIYLTTMYEEEES